VLCGWNGLHVGSYKPRLSRYKLFSANMAHAVAAHYINLRNSAPVDTGLNGASKWRNRLGATKFSIRARTIIVKLIHSTHLKNSDCIDILISSECFFVLLFVQLLYCFTSHLCTPIWDGFQSKVGKNILGSGSGNAFRNPPLYSS
jgi:hypothetical protein